MNPIHTHTLRTSPLLLFIHEACCVAPRLADILGLHLDEAALVVVLNGPVGVVNLRAGEAFAGDAAWKQLLLMARRLGVVLLVVLARVGHLTRVLGTIHGAKNQFNFFESVLYCHLLPTNDVVIVVDNTLPIHSLDLGTLDSNSVKIIQLLHTCYLVDG